MSASNAGEDLCNGDDSLSDSESDSSSGAPAVDYLPISAAEDESDSDAESGEDPDYAVPTSFRSNGGDLNPTAGLRGVSILESQNGGSTSEDEDEEEEEEEEEREAEIQRAFVENERRSSLLTAENAARVMEAMRGVSFAGLPPAWAGQVGEERWASQLRQLRERRAAG